MRKTSSYRPGGTNAKYIGLCLFRCTVHLDSGSPHLHWTTKSKFLWPMVLRVFTVSHFLQGQSGIGCVELWPKKPLLAAFPAEVWHEHERSQEKNLFLLAPGRRKLAGWLLLCCGAWACEWEREYSNEAVLSFAIHWSPHSVPPLQWPHLAVPGVCVPGLRTRKEPIHQFFSTNIHKGPSMWRCYAGRQAYIWEQNQNTPCLLFICLFSNETLTVYYVRAEFWAPELWQRQEHSSCSPTFQWKKWPVD